MPEIADGETVEIKGSAREPYKLKNTGGVYSCTCPAWMHQSLGIERRTCKHLRQYRGEEAERERLGALPERALRAATPKSGATGSAEKGSSPGLLLAHPWDCTTDLKGWWMSEKLDGVRAYWDGKRFFSRQGNEFMAPDWFVKDLPEDMHLDGELWLDRKAFQRAVSIVRRQDRSESWKEITFMVFDAPQTDAPFEERIEIISRLMEERKPQYAKALAQQICDGVDHLRAELARVEALGGEGLMMRKPFSRYESSRSFTLLKVKTFHDAEARVLDYLPGAGKHKGRLGALDVELANGTRFSIGTGFSDYERENPPAIGSIVTFRYQELTDAGVPRFPSYVRERADVDTLPDNVPGSEVKKAPAKAADSDVSSNKTIVRAESQSSPTASSPVKARPPIRITIEGGETRRFEYSGSAVSGTTQSAAQPAKSIMWQIRLEGPFFEETFSKNGNDEVRSESFHDTDSAREKAEHRIARRVASGFVECVPGDDSSDGVRRFQYKSGAQPVIWEIAQDDMQVRMRLLKGDDVEESTRDFQSVSEAADFIETQIARKLRSGFSSLS
ncbi:MAG: DNA ligase [Cyanobacteria bacterium]|nr:DNA ligase [Cyanobacteriota bacterium]